MESFRYPPLAEAPATIRLTCRYRIDQEELVTRSAEVSGFRVRGKLDDTPSPAQVFMTAGVRTYLEAVPGQPFDHSLVAYARKSLQPLVGAFFELAPRLVIQRDCPVPSGQSVVLADGFEVSARDSFVPATRALEVFYQAELLVGGPKHREWPAAIFFHVVEAQSPHRFLARVVHVQGEFSPGVWTDVSALRLNSRSNKVEMFGDTSDWKRERTAFAARHRPEIVAFIDLTPHGQA